VTSGLEVFGRLPAVQDTQYLGNWLDCVPDALEKSDIPFIVPGSVTFFESLDM
jgi:hypothetical protein